MKSKRFPARNRVSGFCWSRSVFIDGRRFDCCVRVGDRGVRVWVEELDAGGG